MSDQATSVLVTGGAGFIGHHLARALASRDQRVRVLDDLSGGKRSRLDHAPGNLEFIQGSILDPQVLAAAMKGVQIVFHHAALVSVPQSVACPVDYHAVDATGTLNVLEAARKAGVRRLVYASSSAAYGEEPEQPKRESHRALPISPYAVAKYAGELYMTAYARCYNLETISLRYFNVFGPQQDPKSQYGAAIPSIVTRMLRGERPTVYGDGEQTRDFCYVDNVVQANLLAAGAASLSGQVVNIACGKRTTVNQIIAAANQLLGTHIEPVYEPPRPGDVRDSLADISSARQLLGYEPVVYFEEGLQRSIRWYQSQVA